MEPKKQYLEGGKHEYLEAMKVLTMGVLTRHTKEPCTLFEGELKFEFVDIISNVEIFSPQT